MFNDPSHCHRLPAESRSFSIISQGKEDAYKAIPSNEQSSHLIYFGVQSEFQASHRTQDTGAFNSFHEGLAPIPTVRALQAISAMRGGAQSKLMLCDDHNLWIVKFQNNPQHRHVLVNELIATKMAESIGLSVPSSGIVDVNQWLIDSSPQLYVDHNGRSGHQPCSGGLQFGSRFVGGLMPSQVVDVLPEGRLQTVRNLNEFIGMLAFDKWTCNRDARQVVYQRSSKERNYKATFIDQGFCFGTPEWKFVDAPLQGFYACKSIYAGVKGWDDFEPWLTNIEQFDPQLLWGFAASVPQDWYEGQVENLERLVSTLLQRRTMVRDLIDQLRKCAADPFPYWKMNSKLYRTSKTPTKRMRAGTRRTKRLRTVSTASSQ